MIRRTVVITYSPTWDFCLAVSCHLRAPTVDDKNPTWPHIDHATRFPRVLVYYVMQDLYHQPCVSDVRLLGPSA